MRCQEFMSEFAFGGALQRLVESNVYVSARYAQLRMKRNLYSEMELFAVLFWNWASILA